MNPPVLEVAPLGTRPTRRRKPKAGMVGIAPPDAPTHAETAFAPAVQAVTSQAPAPEVVLQEPPEEATLPVPVVDELAVLSAPGPAASDAVQLDGAALPRSTPGFHFQPSAHADRKVSTGVDRLDSLLGGGYTPGCATLLFGPPFCGKQQLQQRAIVRAARDGTPVTVLLHTIGAEAMSARLHQLDPGFAEAERSGVVHYVDVHSRALGESTNHPHTTYIGDPNDLDALLKALEPRRRPGEAGGLLAVESASTLLMDLGAAKAFMVLRRVLGRALTAGGVGLVCLEGGMHAESEVQMAKHLCAGMIEMRKKGEAHCLHVEGLETAFARPGWVEYEFTSRTFKVTGSFASRTIR